MVDEKKSQTHEESNEQMFDEKKRHKGKLAKAENKARAVAGKARAKKAGSEPVSDQKSHEYH